MNTMIKRMPGVASLAVVGALLTCATLSASPYAFTGMGNWGITMDVTVGGSHPGSLSFTTPLDVSAKVGHYQWTQLNGVFVHETRVPSPGPSYPGYQQFDAEALFFKADFNYAYFAVVSSTPQTGVQWPSWYGSSRFGPGDLRLKIGADTYGVGMRQTSGLAWDTGNGASIMHRVRDNYNTSSPAARNTATAGMVRKGADWWWTDNPNNSTENKNAFFDPSTGTYTGSASFAAYNTGVSDGGYPNYIFEAMVPWTSLGFANLQSAVNRVIVAYWQPDCGNDGINFEFSIPASNVPEPGSLGVFGTCLSSLLGGICYRRRRS